MRYRSRASASRLACGLVLPLLGATLTGQVIPVSAQQVESSSDVEQVGRVAEGRIVTPVNQLLTPFGRQVDLPGMRPQALALSPDGKLLVTAGKTSEIVAIDPQEGSIQQRVSLPSESSADGPQPPVSEQLLHPDEEGQLSYTGLIFSPSGKRIYMSNVDGSIKVFAVSAEWDPLESTCRHASLSIL